MRITEETVSLFRNVNVKLACVEIDSLEINLLQLTIGCGFLNIADCSVVGLQESCYPQCARGLYKEEKN
jgi:hypothetical protein